jgi:hypothetical protein
MDGQEALFCMPCELGCGLPAIGKITDELVDVDLRETFLDESIDGLSVLLLEGDMRETVLSHRTPIVQVPEGFTAEPTDDGPRVQHGYVPPS